MNKHSPIYATTDLFKHANKSGNLGLLFQRGFNGYNSNWEIDKGDGDNAPKNQFLYDIVRQGSESKVRNSDQLNSHIAKRSQMVSQLGGVGQTYTCAWNWATGLGYSHAVENGLTWHHTLGVPYFPGSSVKGLLRAWMETKENPDLDKIRLWFGDQENGLNKACSGGVIFFDAIPTKPVALTVDVMTPHTGKWLAEGGKDNVPGDWIDPVPVFFLSCEGGELNFAVAQSSHVEDVDIQEVHKELGEALDYIGIGAKTSNGYGVFLNQ